MIREGACTLTVELRGKGVITGISIANVMTLEENLQEHIEAYKPASIEEESAKIKEAIAFAAETLQTNIKTLRDKGMAEQAAIMEAHRMMVQDPMLEESALQKLGDCGSAPQAARITVMDRCRRRSAIDAIHESIRRPVFIGLAGLSRRTLAAIQGFTWRPP